MDALLDTDVDGLKDGDRLIDRDCDIDPAEPVDSCHAALVDVPTLIYKLGPVLSRS